MLPFSKRPPAPEEYFLNSGDFQALPPAQAHPSTPPMAQQQPIFARQREVTPYGFVHQYGDNLNSVPPPANSLAPVAMGTYGGAAHTGSHPQPQVTVREKPSLKWGVMIALTGAVLGGVIGVSMDAKRQQAQASAAASQPENPPAVVAPAMPAPLPVTNTVIAKPTQQPAAPAAQAPINVIPPQPAVVVAANAKDAKPAPEAKNEKAEKPEAKKPVVGRRFFGGHVGKPVVAAPERDEAPAPVPVKKAAPAPEKPAPAEKPAVAEKKAPEKAAPAAKTDAQKVLEEAVKNTANTL
ncbi:MAG: hypothetical protein JST00_13155 [Deltaproteobacteria bacterium]|nr:hypothetical protein [Deltaproteobacteria bacterium]